MAPRSEELSAGPKKVAVIGGGPGGIAAGRFLLRKGHDVTLFEAGSDFGGIWAPDPINRVMYKGLVTNIPTVCMQSFDLDFEAGLPSFVTAKQLGQYIRAYGDASNLRALTRFKTRITKAEFSSSCWRLSWTGASDGAEQFDALVAATGHYEVPYCPEVPGQAAWLAAAPGRRVLHAHQYEEPSLFEDQCVLVVGGRSSGVDISRELVSRARWLYCLEKGCRSPLEEDRATHVPLGTELLPDGHLVFNGERLPGPAIQTVLLATGYTYSFPYLDEDALGLKFGQHRRFVAPLWQHVVHSGVPSLCFIGVPLSVPTPIVLFEAQARLVAAHLAGEVSTTRAQREAWVSRRFAQVGERPQDLHFLGDDAWEHFEELVRLCDPADHGYRRRLDLVAAVYSDRKRRAPRRPWHDDAYRRVAYAVDWAAGTWSVDDSAAQAKL